MLGVLLTGISSAFNEISFSIGKRQVNDGAQSYYTFGFLIQFFSALFICAAGFLFNDLVFSPASFPTFGLRTLVAIVEMQLATIAISKLDRGTFGFMHLLTIPFLLTIDLVLGYALRPLQIAGMGLIILPVLAFFFLERREEKSGLWIAFGVAFLASIDISLYKYDISHFNSVGAEQGILTLILSLYFFLTAVLIKKENPLLFLRRPVYFAQASASGVATVINSFAYLFAPASVIASAFRGFSLLSSLLSGRLYFREKRLLLKVGLFAVIVLGLILLI